MRTFAKQWTAACSGIFFNNGECCCSATRLLVHEEIAPRFAFEAVKDGKLATTFIYPFYAPERIEYACKVAEGEQVPERVLLKSTHLAWTAVRTRIPASRLRNDGYARSLLE